MKRRTITRSIGIVVAILLIALTTGSLYMVKYALCPDHEGKDMKGSMIHITNSYPGIQDWMDSITTNKVLKDTFITAPDGIRLHGFYLKAKQPTKRTAVIVHGYTDNAIRMFHIGHLYHQNLGYNILLPDLRNTGLSEGDAIQMGWLDRKDVMQWMEVANNIFGDSIQAVIHGISMGAATTMMVAGEETPEWVKCFVEDCGYTSVWDQFKKELNEQFGLPAFPLLYYANMMCYLKYGWSFKEASAEAQVKKCHKPMFFIHGDQDDYVPTWMVYNLYEAKTGEKELWVTKDVKHARSYDAYPEEYTLRVKQFTEKYIN